MTYKTIILLAHILLAVVVIFKGVALYKVIKFYSNGNS